MGKAFSTLERKFRTASDAKIRKETDWKSVFIWDYNKK
jgi:hypothetical protein